MTQHRQSIVRSSVAFAGIVLFAGLCGCTSTQRANQAMSKPLAAEPYSGFDAKASASSKRSADRPKQLNTDSDPEEAVKTLTAQLQHGRADGRPSRAYTINAEEELKLWGLRQGVDRIVVRNVRPLLKHPEIEIRAPALRLTVLYGGPESNGDLIEALSDAEYGMRETAIKALQSRTQKDFGFNPTGGEISRKEAIQDWHAWWQKEQRTLAIQPQK